MKLGELGEDRLLAQLLPRLRTKNRRVLAAAGDDCAVVELPGRNQLLLLKTDCVVEDVHFLRGERASAVGWKAMMRPASDFAAMSGVPQFALITLIAPSTTAVSWVKNLYHGLNRAAGRCAIDIVGGETSRTKGPVSISVSLAGFVEKNRWVSRSGGKANDDLFVTGRLGGSLRGHHLRFMPRLAESRWLTQNFPVSAMIDLSDGLGADLPRLAAASKRGALFDESLVPRNRGCTIRQAISDGEDYELLFAISPLKRQQLERAWAKKFPKLLLTRIGQLTRNPQMTLELHGYIHFKQPR